ncbi:hypothetical protein ACORG1_13530 [Mycobacterium sp. TJFP1]
MPRDEERLQALRIVPMLFKSEQFIRERADRPDRAEYAVVALSTDSYWDVVDQTRRYPGWVIVLSVTPPPGGSGEANIDIREFLPRQAQPDDAAGDPDLTIGQAMEMFKYAEQMGIDLHQEAPSVAGAFARQRPSPVG